VVDERGQASRPAEGGGCANGAGAIDEVRRWSEAIDAELRRETRHFRRAIVLEETDSTQEEARRREAAPGDVIIAARQRAGRGRLGRRWHDEHGEGVAMTAVIDPVPAEHQARLSIAAAVAASLAVESLLHTTVGIKWPNDIIVSRDSALRKLAGILIEQDDRIAVIGIGINVLQTQWPDDLRHRATSLHLLGCGASRLDVIIALIGQLDHALDLADDRLVEHFSARDVLRGRKVTLLVDGDVIEGRILRIDPMRELVVRCHEGERHAPVATTSVVHW
jgi:BirA family biotin operon repressor/biotin-[acetyl-CoA-carboxylase] ligase